MRIKYVQKKRYTYRRIFGSLLWSLLGLALVILLGAAINVRNNKHCKGMYINISGNQINFFIDKKEIKNILDTVCGEIANKKLGSFNLGLIENTLKKNQWINNAEIYFDNNEMLRVNISEREPVVRIFTTSGTSFYLDTALAILPLSDKSSARVPVFTNFPSMAITITRADSNLLCDVKNISSYILKDPFWMAQIDQIDITADKTFEMIPKIGNQTIVFGNAENYEEKFNNLLTFYKQAGAKVGWNKYSKINVQYTGQVVAVKRGIEDIVQDSLKTKQIMLAIIAMAQKQANDSINNIQLVQPQEDNIVPAAMHFNDIPGEQNMIDKSIPVNAEVAEKKVITTDKKIISSNTKNKIPETKTSNVTARPFWLNPALIRVSGGSRKVLIKTSVKKNNTSTTEKLVVNPAKKITLIKASPKNKIFKSTIKSINKSTVKTNNKIKTKPKAIMAPKNDY